MAASARARYDPRGYTFRQAARHILEKPTPRDVHHRVDRKLPERRQYRLYVDARGLKQYLAQRPVKLGHHGINRQLIVLQQDLAHQREAI